MDLMASQPLLVILYPNLNIKLNIISGTVYHECYYMYMKLEKLKVFSPGGQAVNTSVW